MKNFEDYFPRVIYLVDFRDVTGGGRGELLRRGDPGQSRRRARAGVARRRTRWMLTGEGGDAEMRAGGGRCRHGEAFPGPHPFLLSILFPPPLAHLFSLFLRNRDEVDDDGGTKKNERRERGEGVRSGRSNLIFFAWRFFSTGSCLGPVLNV